MKIISGSHKYGIINPSHHSSFLSQKQCHDMGLVPEEKEQEEDKKEQEEQEEQEDEKEQEGNDEQTTKKLTSKIEEFWLHTGEVALMHNWVIHCSGLNITNRSRRALSVSFMDARSKLTTDNFSEYVGGELQTTGYPEGGMEFPRIF